MSNRFERGQEGGDAERPSTNLVRILGQMMMLPFTVFVYGLEVLVRTVQDMQRAADQGMDVVAGGTARRAADARGSPGVGQGGASSDESAGGGAGSWNDLTGATRYPSANGTHDGGADTLNREERKMRDRNLSDDMLKLVRYKILFVMRDYEVAFPEQEELVYDNMDDTALTAWKIAEFVQSLPTTPVPRRWIERSYPPGASGGMINSLPEDDKKYLRLYYEVLDRYPREKLYYEDRQLEVLEDIAEALRNNNNPGGSSSATSGATATGGAHATSGGTHSTGGTHPEGTPPTGGTPSRGGTHS
jgi:hypothetical protein